MAMQTRKLDTSPKIAEFGKNCNRSFNGLTTNPDWCYTEWVTISPSINSMDIGIVDAYASKSNNKTYQLQTADGANGDYHYGSTDFSEFTRKWTITFIPERIRWSILIANLDNCYAYCINNGQIFFAGKNTPYYGYTNINDMPSA